MKDSSTAGAGDSSAEQAVRAVQALVVIRIQATLGPPAAMAYPTDCPLCPGPKGLLALEVWSEGLHCSAANGAHSDGEVLRLLFVAAVRKCTPDGPEDPAVGFCLRHLAPRRPVAA
jgi:hypothetical protein